MACFAMAGADAQKVFVAPTSDNIFSDTEVREGNTSAHLIFVTNRSTVPITVFNVTLTACENVKWQCGPKRVNIRIRGGQRVQVMRVEPQSTERSFSYRFGFNWNADSTDAAFRGALGIAKELSPDDFRKLGGRIASIRPEVDSIVIEPGGEVALDRLLFLVRDSSDRVLGQTRWISWSVTRSSVTDFMPVGRLLARKVGRSSVRFRVADEAQQIIGRRFDDIVVPVIVGYPFDPHAPTFTGVALDADTRKPLGCTSVALEDSAHNEVATDRTMPNGMYALTAPRPGTYRVRIELNGWAPQYGEPQPAAADEEKQNEYRVRFSEQLLVDRNEFGVSAFRHATPAAVSTPVIGSRPPTQTPIAPAVILGGSASMPILGIISKVPPGTVWTQFVVDSAGRIDTATIVVPQGTATSARATIGQVLPRVRFSPARNDGVPVCELVKIQVNFSPR